MLDGASHGQGTFFYDPPLRDLSDLKCRGIDLFGSTVVCARPGGAVLVWDVARPRSASNPGSA